MPNGETQLMSVRVTFFDDVFLVLQICERIQKHQQKKATMARDAALRSEKAKIYEAIRPFQIGRFSMDPHHIQLPPHKTAAKDFYVSLKDKIKTEWIAKREAFKCGDTLLTFFKVFFFQLSLLINL